jgi:diguanylate cyclase (GGDEF)-like protein/PAS domain S-box-containing protein
MQAFSGWRRRNLQTAIILPTLFALALTIAGGCLVIARLDEAHAQALNNAFTYETGEITLRIEERLKAHRQVLRGARALFAASEEVTRREWQNYVDALRLHADYPGIQGMGFAVPVPASQLVSHEQRIRSEGFPDYRVSPPGHRAEYTAIIFLEPFDWRNQRAFGYDMYSEPVRREAMERARRLGTPALSGKVRLVQETSTDTQAGVLLYLPVFRHGAPLVTPAQQERAFLGWVYCPFRMRDLITGTLGESAPRIRLRIYDGHDENPASLLFDNHPDHQHPGAIRGQSVLELDNRTWTLVFDSNPALPPDLEVRQLEQAAVLLIGSLLVLLTAFFFSARQRARELDRVGASLRVSEARYSTLVNLSQDGIAALDAKLRFTFLNPRLLKLLGYPEDELIGRSFDSLWPIEDSARSRELGERLQRGEAATSEQELRNADGRVLTAIVTDAPHIDAAGRLQGVILTITDISERKASEERIHYLACHDPLTGLANRAMFMDQMNTSLLISRRHKTRFALLFLDLDHFKDINDSLGHAAGDTLLIEAARRMRHGLRASDLLARQGGDEFMALLHDIHTMHEALGVAEKIRRALNEAFVLDGHECLVSASIGIALYPDHGKDLESLTRSADAAMYRAKMNGRNGASVAPDAPQPPVEP